MGVSVEISTYNSQVATPGVFASRGLMEGDILISVDSGLCEEGRDARRRLRVSYQQQVDLETTASLYARIP